MSQISAIFGTDDDKEILESLYIIANVSQETSSHLEIQFTIFVRIRMGSAWSMNHNRSTSLRIIRGHGLPGPTVISQRWFLIWQTESQGWFSRWTRVTNRGSKGMSNAMAGILWSRKNLNIEAKLKRVYNTKSTQISIVYTGMPCLHALWWLVLVY